MAKGNYDELVKIVNRAMAEIDPDMKKNVFKNGRYPDQSILFEYNHAKRVLISFPHIYDGDANSFSDRNIGKDEGICCCLCAREDSVEIFKKIATHAGGWIKTDDEDEDSEEIFVQKDEAEALPEIIEITVKEAK